MARSAIKRSSPIAIVGAGLSGATIAWHLRECGFRDITVFDERNHVAGNIYTERDPETDVMVHKYGPHIFHTDIPRVWSFVNQFTKMVPYQQRTKALSGGAVYAFPINLHTINQVYGLNLPPHRARQLIECEVNTEKMNDEIAGMSGTYRSLPAIRVLAKADTFEGAAIRAVGRRLYETFLHDYTEKQWGRDPRTLPASILKRLPLRFNYEDGAFSHPHQGIPLLGYTHMVEQMLRHIPTGFEQKFTREMQDGFAHVFYSGPIDEWFGYAAGALPYRTLAFKHERGANWSHVSQGCSVLNCCDYSEPWTRSVEHSYFAPWERPRGTVVTREYSSEWQPGQIRYYPVRLAESTGQLNKYLTMAAHETNVTFVGRLGTFQYLDMDKTILQAMETVEKFRASAGI